MNAVGYNFNQDLTKYVVYFRVSTKKQGESGLGLEAQRAYIDHFYKGKNILAEFTDIRSGKTIKKRPELLKAIAICKKEQATLVVAKVDRLSRNTEHALHIYKLLGERLESCDIPNLDKFTLTLFMAIADRERELISIRTKMAVEARRIREGEWRVSGPNEKKAEAAQLGGLIAKEMALDNENNQRAIAYIKLMRAAGNTYQTIADNLTAAKFKTASGGEDLIYYPAQVWRLYKRSLTLESEEVSGVSAA